MLDLDLTYRRGDFTLTARFAAGPGLTAITGPSGAGKTTLLNLIAGLLRPATGHIRLDGVALTDLPPHRRRIGYVFQEARLFPHLSVRQNLRYGRLFARHPAPATLADITDLLDIGPLLDRRPRDLSGGEKQRVAIGRALLAAPRLILLDEPLAALDAARKAELLPYLARLHDQMRLPMLYVTHHPAELRGLAGGWLRVAGGMAAPAPAPDQ
ncbi:MULTISPECIES: molybdenum ABC transporter ATP-binding protein [unclassified Azospirillum]|uniref:molybdenum ABC transporter ATP-binding protein n=1 Tax=unclassified Azospirillum TaxID=2630922 RepID=UPI000B73382C|nr:MULTISPECIES: ATP-binding cassette domain-containing protein [unclassified Azospirillum]SNS29821.1 molybdenum ABC transporter, ATP-binding protein [Azospirillum sp. RU38E]SNS48242.1 molybdenum ABC transporter, ATP-binding protein [Azospirillum sp. RU37A]